MPRKNSAELIYNVTKESLSAQQAQKATLESKASTLTGFAAGMIALLLGFKDNIVSLPSIAKLMVITSIVLFLLSILLATIVGWVRKYRSDPNPQSLAENYLDEDESKVKLQLIANLLGTWRNNSRQLEKNAVLLRFVLVWFLV
jgi:Na+/melibiose symporter-like transporter